MDQSQSESVADQSELVVKICFEARARGREYLSGWWNNTFHVIR